VTLLKPQTGDIPVPYPGVWSRPFWEGCARGELRFQRCADCGAITHTPAVMCASCTGRTLNWENSTGTGSVYSWTTVWRPQTPAFEIPYVPIIVDVDEGWQILSNLVGCEHDAVEVGMRVEVEFHRLNDEITLPYFRPA